MLGIYCRTSIQQDVQSSTISQQRTAGIKFAENNNFEYEIYEDEGKSGFKISDDDQDPFNNRPSFTNLINDIKAKKIDKVWVWEHSRLSRNQYASAFIFNVFEKYKTTLYENNKEFKMDDPQFKFMRQMLDAVAEYERQLIVARTTRGKHKKINEGFRVYQKLYGYESVGKNEKGHSIWKPVESEIETYKFILKRYLEGASLRKICLEVYHTDQLNMRKVNSLSTHIGAKLRGYQYTGYQLTVEGSAIYKEFRKGKTDSLQILLDRKYWVKSIPFPLELVSIENWVMINEKLQVNTAKFLKGKNARILRADKDIATGIVECGKCGMRYYSHEQINKNKKTGRILKYESYYHNSAFTSGGCKQRPKSFKVEYLNEIFKLFFFYFYLVFDNTNDLIKESQRTIRHTQIKLKEVIIKLEKEKSAVEKRILKFQKVIENSADEIDVVKYLVKNITSSEEKLEEVNLALSKTKIDYEIQNEKFNRTLLEMTYYDVKEKINNWFSNSNIEEQRNELIKIIKKCLIFNHYIIIDTGKIVFLFDINQHYEFDMKLLENLNKDEVYKSHFVEMKNKKEVKLFNEKMIVNINLNRSAETRNLTFRYIVEQFGVLYSLDDITNLISFVSLKGFYNQDE